MKIFDANISLKVVDFFTEELLNVSDIDIANNLIEDISGIKTFFEEESEINELKEKLTVYYSMVEESDRPEYGDFQTNSVLANKVANHLHVQGFNPEIIIEPTCGKGSFIIASLNNFKAIKHIIGIEIFKPYVWETKFNILDFFLKNPKNDKQSIEIIHCNVFDFDFNKLSKRIVNNKLLIIGNPPWVTNSQLGSLNSTNLPKKANFKNQNGLDAITGKGNFDIAEYITLSLLDAFQDKNGYIALLVKNSVIKNMVFYQKTKQYRMGCLEKHVIDSKKEFNVSVEAALFYGKLNTKPEIQCKEFNFYTQKESHSFGWVGDKFVSNIKDYIDTQSIDGKCAFEWRQGIKHDCAAVMELKKVNGNYINNKDEQIELESDLVYGFLKSSDLKNTVIKETRKYTIVTQTKVGQETNYIKHKYPKTYLYLYKHSTEFQARKSSIYIGKPMFSIFGIGDYSFMPYKVAISGLYKTFHFTLVLPQNNKAVMLDDTCYFIGFEKIEYAVYSIILLNASQTKEFLDSITFSDAKRVFTKDILMRIDFLKLASMCSKDFVKEQLDFINEKYNLNIEINLWESFVDKIKPTEKEQMSLFI